MVLLGLFPVLPLKVLVARKVIREGMDYESYIPRRQSQGGIGRVGGVGREVCGRRGKVGGFRFEAWLETS